MNRLKNCYKKENPYLITSILKFSVSFCVSNHNLFTNLVTLQDTYTQFPNCPYILLTFLKQSTYDL